MEQLQLKLADRITEQAIIKCKITEAKERIDKLEWRFVNGEIDKALYDKYNQKLQEEVLQLEQEMNTSDFSSSNFEKAVKKGLQMARNLRQLWLSSDYDHKQKLQYLVYPEGIHYNKQEDLVRTPRVNSVFSAIASASRILEEKKSGSSKNLSRDSH